GDLLSLVAIVGFEQGPHVNCNKEQLTEAMSKVSKFVLGAKDMLDEVVHLVVTVKYPFLNKVVDCCDHPLATVDVLEPERLARLATILNPPSRSVIASPSLLKQLTIVLASTDDSPLSLHYKDEKP
ncbi:hypothetical protein Tco_1086524, partial [Tanacetum coccineum]